MHLGQTASYLAEVLNRPEPKCIMFSRLLRQDDWVQKGPRGRNAHHLDSLELANFLIGLMACPDSPAVGMERLPHFSGLPLDTARDGQVVFSQALAVLLDRLAGETWQQVCEKNWRVSLAVHFSSASIVASPSEGSEAAEEEHWFSNLIQADEADQSMIDFMPYFGGLEFTSEIHCLALYRISTVVLAGADDPLPQIKAQLTKETAK